MSKVVKKLSKVAKKLPKSCQKVVKKLSNTRASLDQVATSSHLVKTRLSRLSWVIFEHGRMMEEEKNEGFPRPGGDFVAPGNKSRQQWLTLKYALQSTSKNVFLLSDVVRA
jgi:hypothetical protein